MMSGMTWVLLSAALSLSPGTEDATRLAAQERSQGFGFQRWDGGKGRFGPSRFSTDSLVQDKKPGAGKKFGKFGPKEKPDTKKKPEAKPAPKDMGKGKKGWFPSWRGKYAGKGKGDKKGPPSWHGKGPVGFKGKMAFAHKGHKGEHHLAHGPGRGHKGFKGMMAFGYKGYHRQGRGPAAWHKGHRYHGAFARGHHHGRENP